MIFGGHDSLSLQNLSNRLGPPEKYQEDQMLRDQNA